MLQSAPAVLHYRYVFCNFEGINKEYIWFSLLHSVSELNSGFVICQGRRIN